MKANYYNHMNRMNRSNTASKQVRRTNYTVRFDRNRMELKPDEPPDIRRVLAYLDPQTRDGNDDAEHLTTTDLLGSDKDAAAGETYEINTQIDMNNFVAYVNSGRNTKNVTFKMAAGSSFTVSKIIAPTTLSAYEGTDSPVPNTGDQDIHFEGTLDGNHSKVALTIVADTTDSTSLTAVGLFGVIGVNGSVKDLTLTGKVSAGADAGAVGALAGYNSGIIDGVTNRATVYAPKCYNVGGIAGFNDAVYVLGAHGTITNCVNHGPVTGFEKVGGITGENAGLIGSCANIAKSGEADLTAAILGLSNRRSGVGGIAGRNGNNNTVLEKGHILDCYNLAHVTGGTATGGYAQWVGGIAGFQNAGSDCGYSYNAGELLGDRHVHSIIGENDNATVTIVDEKQVVAYHGITNCYGQEGMTTPSAEEQEDTDGATDVSELEMKGRRRIETTSGEKYLVDLLNEGNKDKDYWEQDSDIDEGYPYLLNNFTGETGSVTDTPSSTEVYLDGFDGDKITGTGRTSSSPYHNLAEAVEAAGAGGTIVMTKPITIDQPTSICESVTFKRGFTNADDAGKAMFEIDIPNVIETDAVTDEKKPALGYLTMTSATIDGGGTGTLFNVKHGRLRLRGKITLQNCETAVSVDGQGPAADLLNAQVEVNYATIKATGNAIKLANANSDFILDAFNAVSIIGTIYLGTGSYITVGAAIPCELNVEYTSSMAITVIAKGTNDYLLDDDDLGKLKVSGKTLRRIGNQIIAN